MVSSRHRPLSAYRITSLISVFLHSGAFILLLLVGISLPIIKSVYIIRVFSTVTSQPPTSIDTELRFGVWGVCASSALNPPTVFTNDGDCFGPKLGYAGDIPTDLLTAVGVTEAELNIVLQGLLTVLILHLVAAGFSLAALFTSLFLASHGLTILSLILTVLTAIVTSVVFAVDAVIAVTARDQLPGLTDGGIGVSIGNAVWMVLAALIASWIAVVLLSAKACYCFGYRSARKMDTVMKEKHAPSIEA